jgi:ABC-2 type transport system ATP-binding protein
MNKALLAQDLTRVFSVKSSKGKNREEIRALDAVNLEVNQGELFGLLGPNGAGKTSLIKIFSTLLLPTSGKAYVAGHDVERDTLPIRKTINVIAGGEYSGYGILNVRENLWMFSQFYNVDGKTAQKRIGELLKIVGMEDRAHTRVNQLSTGMRQKLNFARGFINDPEIIFLDEPTLGLDVSASRDLRSYIRQWITDNPRKTVLLTTHYMYEAEELCDRVAIIDRGKIVACDSPENLKKSIRQSSGFEITARSAITEWQELGTFPGVKGFSSAAGEDGETLHFKFLLEHDLPLENIFSMLIHRGAAILSVKKTDVTLEDVFMALCGRGLEDDNNAA